MAQEFEDTLDSKLETAHGTDTPGQLESAIRGYVGLNYAFTIAPGDASVQVAAAIDQRNAQLHMLASKGVGFIPMGKAIDNPIAESIASDVVNFGIGDVAEHLLPTDNSDNAKVQRAYLEQGGEARMKSVYLSALTQMPVENWTEPFEKSVTPNEFFAGGGSHSPWTGTEFRDYDTMFANGNVNDFKEYISGGVEKDGSPKGVGHPYFQLPYYEIGDAYDTQWTRSRKSDERGD